MRARIAAAAALALAACTPPTPAASPQDAFFANLTALCGQSYAGRVVSTDAADADMAGQALVMHVRDCSDSEIRIPFNVGENRSRQGPGGSYGRCWSLLIWTAMVCWPLVKSLTVGSFT